MTKRKHGDAVLVANAEEKPRVFRRGRNRFWVFLSAAVLLILVFGLSLFVGSNPLSPAEVWQVLLNPDDSFASVVVHEQRLPRALLVVVVAAALAVAGLLMQALTRNPLAEPGILGVNAGASLAVVAAVAFFGVVSIWFYMWFAFLGAALAAVGVYVLGASGKALATPARLALAGVAITMAISSLVQTVILADQQAFNEFRFWAAGSAEGRGFQVLFAVSGVILVGIILAWSLAPSLNALALGDDTGRALGVRPGLTRVLVMVASTLLAGAATAAVGPLMFVGLGVPFLARMICGADARWTIPLSVLLAPVMLLAADILARIVVMPGELPLGAVAAIIGGPVFIAIVRRRRIEAL